MLEIPKKKERSKKLTIGNSIEEINSIIRELPSIKKIDVCKKCRRTHGDFKEYDVCLQDIGLCSICLEIAEVLNYSILDLVNKYELTPEQYHLYTDHNTGINYSGLRKSRTEKESMLYMDLILEQKQAENEKNLRIIFELEELDILKRRLKRRNFLHRIADLF